MLLNGTTQLVNETNISTWSIESFSKFLIKFDQAFTGRFNYRAKSVIIADERAHLPTNHQEDDIIKVHLRRVAIDMIQSNLHSEKNSELSAMIDVSKHFNLPADLKNTVRGNAGHNHQEYLLSVLISTLSYCLFSCYSFPASFAIALW